MPRMVGILAGKSFPCLLRGSTQDFGRNPLASFVYLTRAIWFILDPVNLLAVNGFFPISFRFHFRSGKGISDSDSFIR